MNHWYDNTISQGILKEKYYHKGEKTPEEFMDRVSSIFDPELKKRVRGYLEDTSFCPAGRTLYAAGAKGKFKVSMSNCYILPSPEDNLESIFRANYEIARIFSYGGGIGINISNLRPKGERGAQCSPYLYGRRVFSQNFQRHRRSYQPERASRRHDGGAELQPSRYL